MSGAAAPREAARRAEPIERGASRVEKLQRFGAICGEFRRPTQRIHILLAVIDAQFVEDGCREIRYFDGIFCDICAVLVGLAPYLPTWDARACEAHGECIRPVVAAGKVVDLR